MSARILVVDDNASNLELMLYLLRAFGYDAQGTPDGLSGLAAARSGSFDLVLLDMSMPGIDGYEFARRFKSDDPPRKTPLVAVTALAMVGDRERILASGLDGYIAKPIDPASFVKTVEVHLAKAGRLDRPAPSRVESQAPEPRREPSALVLAVDDVPENLELSRVALAPSGYQVIDARSVDEAILLIDRVRPQLVLCDLHMPRRDGFELLDYLRADPSLAEIPFVFISSTGWLERDQQRGIERGAKKFLRRPIDPERLRAEIEELLRR